MASVAPVTTFPDDPESWLDYLVRVTRWTIGARCVAAEVVAVGQFDGPRSSLIQADVIKGAVDAASITVDLPVPTGAGAPSRYPVPQDGDRLLAFLSPGTDRDTWRPVDAPGAVVLGAAAEDLPEDVAAARWFCSLADDSSRRADELAAAIEDARLAVRLTAIRAIADEGLDSAVAALQDAASDDTTEPRTATYAAVALWLLGHRTSATEALDAIVRRVGAEEFLTLWQVQRSLGDQSATLYGPDPDGWKAS